MIPSPPPTPFKVLVNRELIRPRRAVSDGFDLHLLGNCDDVIEHICARLGWELPPISQAVTHGSPPDGALSAVGGDDRSSCKPRHNGSPEGAGETRSIPLPSFVPPNSYVFSPSTPGGSGDNRVGDAESSALASFAGDTGGSMGEGDENSTEFVEVVTW